MPAAVGEERRERRKNREGGGRGEGREKKRTPRSRAALSRNVDPCIIAHSLALGSASALLSWEYKERFGAIGA